MNYIISLITIGSQLFGIIKVFGGLDGTPVFLNIIAGLGMIFFMISAFGSLISATKKEELLEQERIKKAIEQMGANFKH